MEENFKSIDYAVFQAGQLGLKLIVPLTGNFMNQNTFCSTVQISRELDIIINDNIVSDS